MLEKVNFGLQNLTKKKSRNTTKYHHIFIGPIFSTMVDPILIFYYLILTYNELTPQ